MAPFQSTSSENRPTPIMAAAQLAQSLVDGGSVWVLSCLTHRHGQDIQ